MKRVSIFIAICLSLAVIYIAGCAGDKKTSGKLSFESFEKFHKKFFADSISQMSRIDFPLPGTHYVYDKNLSPQKLSQWKENEWNFVKDIFPGEDTIVVFGKDTYRRRIIRTDNIVSEKIFMEESGFQITMTFGLKKGRWHLIRFDEFNF